MWTGTFFPLLKTSLNGTGSWPMCENWDPMAVAGFLREAGNKAFEEWQNPRIELKDDKSVVTPADYEIEKLFAGYFDHPDKGSYLIGEETVLGRDESYIRSAMEGTAWVVDPIDGTAPFCNGLHTWGISIGMMEKGILTHGAIYLPAFDEIFLTEGERVLYSRAGGNFEPLQVKEREINHYGAISISQSIAKRGAISVYNPVQCNGSCVYSMMSLLKGSYLAYIASVKLWDLAAGLAILLKAGFLGMTVEGRLIGPDVVSQTYRLSPDDTRRWKTQEHIIFAQNKTVASYLADRVDIPRLSRPGDFF